MMTSSYHLWSFFYKSKLLKLFFPFLSPFAEVSEGCLHLEGGLTEAVALVTLGEVLTTRQLVVRRGLAVFFMLLMLAAGIVLKEMLTGFLMPLITHFLNEKN